MAFFMHDLHCQIEHLYQEWIDKPNLLTVYRGQIVTQSDFEKLKIGQGGLLSFNSFLSTSTNREVSLIFADSNGSDATFIGIFFAIKINSKLSSTPFISLGNLSHFEEENEILFSMHSIFEIGEIHQINERLWQVELLSTINNDKRMTELTDYIRQHTTKSVNYPWFRLAELFFQMGHHDEAEGILQQLADLLSIYAPNSMVHRIVLHRLGLSKHVKGDFTNALSLFEKVLQHHDTSVENSAYLHIELGKTHFSMNNYSTALLNYKKSLEILETTTNCDSYSFGICLGYIGETYLRLGKPRDAQFYVKKAIEICRRILPSVHPFFGNTYNWMGEANRMTGDYPTAIHYYELALKIQEKYLPPDHLDLAHTLDDLGIVHETLQNHSSALSYQQKALQIRSKSLSSNHPDLAKNYVNIGSIYESTRNYIKALSFYQKAVDIYEAHSDEIFLDLATAYHNIGNVFLEMRDCPTSLGFFRRCLKIEEQKLSPDHPTVAKTYSSMAVAHLASGENAMAASLLRKALMILEKDSNSNGPDLANTYRILSGVYFNMNDYPTALSRAYQAREIYESIYPPTHSERVMLDMFIALVHEMLKNN
ncbi:unnamed protein product [Adineta steineri]|uniref:Tetratricopeptide repeat protein n=1 Tax=Adineta steineri TaxID=433720 RepID=A0A819HQS0_9BILA|nr:unnamed protein product [Adineta steineri]CAF3900986.1 unnamed protein product [Adineta steineri]